MFTCGLDVIKPDTVIKNIHMANYSSANINAFSLSDYLDAEVKAGHMLRTKVGFGPTPARVVPVAFIPKPGQPGKFRLISDASSPEGSSPNSSSPPPTHFRMVTPADVMARADRSTWAAVTDVDAAFRNLPLNPAHAGLLAIEFNGYYYWELRVPFGWTLAPFAWCRVSSVIQRYCALHGYNVIVYVDDFLCLGQSEAAANQAQDFLVVLLHTLGLRDKPSKQRRASQVVPFIGFIFDFPNLAITISPDRADDILNSVNHILSLRWVRSSTLRTLAGKLSFVSQAVLGGRTFSRRIFDACSGPRSKTPLTSSLSADLRWWVRYLLTFNGRKQVHWSTFRPLAYCSSDASDTAACGVCPYPRAWVHVWTNKQAWHINIRELWAVYRNLVLWGPKWDNHDVAVATDNAAVLAWINKGTARSPQAMALLRKMFWLLASHNIRLRAVWIPSFANVAADAGSRLQFDILYSCTGLLPNQVTLSGSLPSTPLTLYPLPSRCAAADHLQTWLALKAPWPSLQSRVYSPRWQTPPSLPTEAPGSPCFGFSWPTSGLPSRLSKNCWSGMLPTSGLPVTPTPPSALISLLSLPYTWQSGSSSPFPKISSQHWPDAYEAFVDLLGRLNLNRILPSPCWSSSAHSLISIPPSSLHSGLHSAWASSPSYDPATWFLSLKDLGNQVPTLHVAMSVLSNGVPYFVSDSLKLNSLMVPPSKYPYRISLEPTFAQSLPCIASFGISKPTMVPPCSPSPGVLGSLMLTFGRSSSCLPPSATSTLPSLGAIAPGVEAPLSLPRSVDLTTTSSFKVCGSQMHTFVTSDYRSIRDGSSPHPWPPLPSLS